MWKLYKVFSFVMLSVSSLVAFNKNKYVCFTNAFEQRLVYICARMRMFKSMCTGTRMGTCMRMRTTFVQVCSCAANLRGRVDVYVCVFAACAFACECVCAAACAYAYAYAWALHAGVHVYACVRMRV